MKTNIFVTIPMIGGFIASVAMFFLVQSYRWNWDFASVTVLLFLLTVAYFYGMTATHLLIESYWYPQGEARLSIAELFWGWLGIGIGGFMAYSNSYMPELNFVLWTGIAWGAVAFPYKVLTLK